MITRFKQWWSRQYATDQAAFMTICFGVVLLIISVFVLID